MRTNRSCKDSPAGCRPDCPVSGDTDPAVGPAQLSPNCHFSGKIGIGPLNLRFATLDRDKVSEIAIKVPSCRNRRSPRKRGAHLYKSQGARKRPFAAVTDLGRPPERLEQARKGRGSASEQPSPAATLYHDPGELLSRSWCHFIAIWGLERGLARPPGADSHDLGSSTARPSGGRASRPSGRSIPVAATMPSGRGTADRAGRPAGWASGQDRLGRNTIGTSGAAAVGRPSRRDNRHYRA